MSTENTNPNSGLALKFFDPNQMHPINDLADVSNRVTALDNLTGSKGTTVTITAVAGAANVSTVTVTVKDANGNTVTGVHWLELITTSDAAGTTISTTSYSGSLVAGTGALLITYTAKHAFRIATADTGIFVGSLTDTAKTADYIVVRKPMGGGVVVSAAAAFGA